MLKEMISTGNAFCSFGISAAHLAWLVEAYLEEFFILYDVAMTPKQHYLVHLPQQILE